MKTSQKEYNELLYAINDPNNLTDEPIYYRIPADEPIYKIDLEKREIEAPEFLSVLEDHNAEVIWFKVDRFFDDVDLYGATCWIQYINALKEEEAYNKFLAEEKERLEKASRKKPKATKDSTSGTSQQIVEDEAKNWYENQYENPCN